MFKDRANVQNLVMSCPEPSNAENPNFLDKFHYIKYSYLIIYWQNFVYNFMMEENIFCLFPSKYIR